MKGLRPAFSPMAGIYIHIPFCLSKCVYCGFYSVANLRGKGTFLDALEKELTLRQDYIVHKPITTVYFGGGTPNLLTIGELEGILRLLSEHFDLGAVHEMTIEANPELLTQEYCSGLRALGFNRLSIGVQSFQDPVLRFMGRRHTAEDALKAVRNAAAFDNLSIDLIYGVSERDDAHWREDLRTALALPVHHLSCYALTPEENSILYKQIARRRHAPVDDDHAARQYQILLEMLPHSALRQYEISNFATPGFESKHNSSYWNHTPYLGLGPSAHSFDGVSRQWNPANLQQYCDNMAKGIPCEEREALTANELYNETLLLGLRTRAGVDLKALAGQFGETRRKELEAHFHTHVAPELHRIEKDRICLTETGLWFADGIAQSAFLV